MTEHDSAWEFGVLYEWVDMVRLLKLFDASMETSAEEGDDSNE